MNEQACGGGQDSGAAYIVMRLKGANKFVIMICTIMHAVQGTSEKQGSGGLWWKSGQN